jgi:[protein-PII] uridylyltransferase
VTSGHPSIIGRLVPGPGAKLLIDLAALDRALQVSGNPLEPLKLALKHADQVLADQFWNNEPVEILVLNRAWLVEQLLIKAWDRLMPDTNALALVAVGGFGRGELHPQSDVDLMILLHDAKPAPELKVCIEDFLALLWDTGLYLGHSVRTIEQCAQESLADVITATTLMESRLLAGDQSLFDGMHTTISSKQMWSGPKFFEAKYREQLERHERFHATAYNLEPNIKEGPGGLRDIQMISWVSKRHFADDSLHGLVEHGFLTEIEFEKLRAGQLFLWRVRFALHLLAGRAEDRLLFDYQRQIAVKLGYGQTDGSNEAVEKFMQQYYRVVMQLERLNESLLQLFREELMQSDNVPVDDLGSDFHVQKGFLGVQEDHLFERKPQAMIQMFVLLAGHPEILGVRASTIRLIRGRVQTIDDEFRKMPEVLSGFYDLLCQPEGIYTQLQRMNRYGVLAALIPSFAKITGLMQFDLFHVYTVDQHILFVVRNLRRFAYGKYADLFPRIAEIYSQIKKPELLYLAALFHDIAKGREGDHSDLGAVDAQEFCESLSMPKNETALVSWLVQNHLLMSKTAQRKDISDPEVIAEFANHMGSQERLVHLYLLTVADIAATSPKLWNGWKSGLLRALYLATSIALEGGDQPDADEQVHNSRRDVLRTLLNDGFDRGEILKVWKSLPADIFQRFSYGQLNWATRCLLSMAGKVGVVISIRTRTKLSISEVLVSAPDYTGLFAATTSVFDEMELNVLSARVLTTRDDRSFDLFQLMDARGLPLNKLDREQLNQRLQTVLGNKQVSSPVQRKLPRRLRPFLSASKIRFDTARSGTVTSLDLECTDRPGLLSQLAAAIVACDIRIHDAKIATFGDRAEDTFLVTDNLNRPLNETQRSQLVEAINQRLELN